MKNSFKFYTLIWGVLFILFNAVVFLVRPVILGYIIQYDARFWIAWLFIILSFAGNLVCTYIALKQDNLKKVFYHLPLITISRTALIAMGVAGIILMLIPNFPAWITAVVCILIFAFNAIAVVKSSWAADAVESIDEKVKTKTSFIKNVMVDAESILARAKNPEIKADCKRVYEAIRYSDPMSDEALSVIEAKITVKLDEFSEAVQADDLNKAKAAAEELVILVGDRNKKCKNLKR